MERLRGIWLRMRSLRKKEDRATADGKRLERDLWEAHRQWQLARIRLDEALGPDEVDYAVLMLEAAEKRFGMLLRKAKEQGLGRAEWRPAAGRPARPAIPSGGGEEAGWSKDG